MSINDHGYREVMLREERDVKDSRFLWAYVDDEGHLHVDSQDLGPKTSIVSPDGEYEWMQAVASEHVPALIALLGGAPGDDVLELLQTRYTGRGSYELERVLRESDIPVERFVV